MLVYPKKRGRNHFCFKTNKTLPQNRKSTIQFISAICALQDIGPNYQDIDLKVKK